MVIFGAGGDLTKRLLFPTLCHMGEAGMLDDSFTVLGVAGHDYGDESFRNYLLEGIGSHIHGAGAIAIAKKLASKMHYIKGRFENPQVYQDLVAQLTKLNDQGVATANYLFYMACPPGSFLPITKMLNQQGLLDESSGFFRRVVYEKPFGHDLPSAIALNYELSQLLSEQQIYRMDHFLGKETVQNLIAFRFANGIFEHLWNHNFIDHVQITVAETLGIGQRGGFYDQAGAMKDMVPNHCFQLLSLIAMEPPVSLLSGYVRDEKSKVLKSIRPLTPGPDSLVRAQYVEGTIAGQKVNAYLAEDKVPPTSRTETYVAMKLMIDNWRWVGVPFYIRTGKRLKNRVSEIVIQFKRPPVAMFHETQIEELSPNQLIIRLQPKEGIRLKLGAKVPGPRMRIGDVELHFGYRDYFSLKPRTGYETLLYDCMIGDSTLYQRADMVEASWRVVEPILESWSNDKSNPIPTYESGSDGPKEAAKILVDGHEWRDIGDK